MKGIPIWRGIEGGIEFVKYFEFFDFERIKIYGRKYRNKVYCKLVILKDNTWYITLCEAKYIDELTPDLKDFVNKEKVTPIGDLLLGSKQSIEFGKGLITFRDDRYYIDIIEEKKRFVGWAVENNIEKIAEILILKISH
ncbi:MAG: hypothetical protein ACTSVV_10770 [Promethearchaeota archaeon]